MSYGSKRNHNPFVLKLIEEIKSHECLWNVQSKAFNNKGSRKKAWTDIADKLHRKVPVIRAKWKNLKDTYRKELKKNTMDEEFHGVWLYYDNMDFLRKVMDVGDKSESEIIEGFTIDDSQSLSDEDASMSYVSLKEENNFPTSLKTISENNVTGTMFVHSTEEIMLNPQTNRVDEEELYDEQFLISLLPFFRRLDPLRKLKIRSKIQAAVIEELKRNIRDPIGN